MSTQGYDVDADIELKLRLTLRQPLRLAFKLLLDTATFPKD